MSISDKVKAYFDKGLAVSKTALDKGAEVSKKALDKAGTAVQDFSDKSVVRIEKRQFEAKRDELYKNLGKLIAEAVNGGQRSTFAAADADISASAAEIKHLDEEIRRREAVLGAAE